MNRFARLYAALDGTNATSAKVDAMVAYFTGAPAADAAWAVFFLTGRRLTRLIPHRSIGRWAMAFTGLYEWLLGECYSTVGGNFYASTQRSDGNGRLTETNSCYFGHPGEQVWVTVGPHESNHITW